LTPLGLPASTSSAKPSISSAMVLPTGTLSNTLLASSEYRRGKANGIRIGVGIGIGVTLFLGLVMGCAWVLARKSLLRKSQKQSNPELTSELPDSGSSVEKRVAELPAAEVSGHGRASELAGTGTN
jgi:hypothetical protein